jgi:hypothetical protein
MKNEIGEECRKWKGFTGTLWDEHVTKLRMGMGAQHSSVALTSPGTECPDNARMVAMLVKREVFDDDLNSLNHRLYCQFESDDTPHCCLTQQTNNGENCVVL